jgi:ABC-type molybdate transport system permease subunit
VTLKRAILWRLFSLRIYAGYKSWFWSSMNQNFYCQTAITAKFIFCHPVLYESTTRIFNNIPQRLCQQVDRKTQRQAY